MHDKHKEQDNKELLHSLINLSYKNSKYTTYKIYEPKERLIYRLPYYPDRIMHHAVMNILEPIWYKIFINNTYSCIKNRGIHKAAKDIKRDLSRYSDETEYCLKMDIKKFYPSIDNDTLYKILCRKIKDKKLLILLSEVVYSTKGVPIGNYLSQYFANLYLSYFDHWIKEECKVRFYYRYADDIVILSDDKSFLRNILCAIKVYLRSVLKLELKGNYQIFPVSSRGIDFVGYKFYHTHVLLRKSIKKNIFKSIRRKNYIASLDSYRGWLKYCNSKNLLKKIESVTGRHYSNWNGEKMSISNLVQNNIRVIEVERRSRYYKINFIYRKNPYFCISRNKRLFEFLITNKLPLNLIIYEKDPR